MTRDASFADGADKPLNLVAYEAEDLPILSALAQDAVFPITEMHWDRRQRRLVLLLNRFRWELSGHGPERVQSLLSVENVQAVASQGIDRTDKDTVCSLLSAGFEPGYEGSGHVILTLAGDGAVRVAVEALELRLKDVTRPYQAPSGQAPRHEI